MVENNKAISEVNAILNQLEPNSLEKVPKKLLEEIKRNATEDVNYIKAYIPLKKLKLEEETKEILAVISYNYFCTPEEKIEWDKELNENERKYQEKLKEKYNPDNLFNKKQEKIEEIEKKTALVEYKETFLEKIWNKIKRFFNYKIINVRQEKNKY